MIKRHLGRDHPLILTYAHYLEYTKQMAYGSLSSYLTQARRLMEVLSGSGYEVSADLAQAHIALKRLYEHSSGGLYRLLRTRLEEAKITPSHVNSFETFLAKGLPLAARWHGDATRTLQRALGYLDGKQWQEHVAPLVFSTSSGFRLTDVQTQEQREAIEFVNMIGGCVDCGRSPMEKGVIRNRRGHRRTGDTSRYLVVSCGEVNPAGNPCQRGWRASTARLDVEDSLIRYNPNFIPREGLA